MSEYPCPSCGTVNPPDHRFCGTCGSALERICPVCGTANPLSNRFCGTCGSPLEAAGPAEALEERKVVSMLFADLAASTEMASRLDPEDLRAILKPFFDAMAEVIERYGGTVEKFIGDAVVAAFGAPAAHEDDPQRAIRCALAMQARIPELNAELAERAGGDLALRIGINTGEVLAHSIEEGIVTGEAVNIAARLQAMADAGGVIVGERTYRLARHGFTFDDLGEVEVKGVDRPLHVFAVRGERAAPEIARTRESPFVGRRAEMDLLRLLFSRTVDERRPNLVTIVGPPGIGKSRLSREAARALEAEGARVVRGRCLPYGDGLTYWPLAEILRADADILDSDTADVVLAKARHRLDPRFPGDEGMGITAILLSSIGIEVPSDPLAGAEPSAAHRMIARAWQRYAEAFAADGPLVALIEDVHWADPSLLDLVEAVAARASGPMLIVCMARPELFERRPGWSGGSSNATTLSLSPLSAGDGTALIEHLLDGGAPAEIVGPILHRSEGNPFFAGELLRMMIEDGTIARGPSGWALVRELPSALPDTVQGVIAARIDLLEPAEKRAIQDASVIGRTFWQGGIARLGTPDAERQVDALIAKGLVREQETSSVEGERELLFAHVLIRDVAYAGIPRARRMQAHAVVGEWIEAGTRGRAEEFAEILAYHFSLAENRERTARYALLAGQRVLRVFAAEEAIGWFDRALQAATDPAVRADAALVRGSAKEQLGRFEAAKGDYELALSEARDASDDEREARALAAIPHVLWLLDRYDEGQARLPEALEKARAARLHDVEARLLYTAGTIRFGRGEFSGAVPLHEEALQVASANDDREGQALAHHGLCESFFFLGPFERALEHGLDADRTFTELGQRPMVAHNAYMVAWALGFLGRLEESWTFADSSFRTSAEIGNRRDEAFARFNRGWLALEKGRLGEAAEDVRLGRETFHELGLRRGELGGLAFGMEVLGEAGDVEGLVRNAEAALALSDDLGGSFLRPQCLALRGWAALATGDVEGARPWFEQADAFDEDLLNIAWSSRTQVMAGEWSREPAFLDRAGLRLRDRLLPGSPFWGAWGPYALGLAALLEERFTDALDLVAEALAVLAEGHERLRWRIHRVGWRAAGALGKVDEAERFADVARTLVGREADSASGDLRERFLARPDVAELLA